MATTTERPDRPETEIPATDAQTSSGAAAGWVLFIVLSFAVTLVLLFRAAMQM